MKLRLTIELTREPKAAPAPEAQPDANATVPPRPSQLPTSPLPSHLGMYL